MTDKIAVIGAGVVGIMVARKLQRDGREVLLYDPQPPAMQCSFGNAGYIPVEEVLPLSNPDTLKKAPQMLTQPLAPVSLRWLDLAHLMPWFLRFAVACRPSQVERGTKTIAALMTRAKGAWLEEIDHSELGRFLRQKGVVRVYETAGSYRDAAHERDAMRGFGVEFQDLSRAQTRDLVPGLTNEIYGSFFVPGGAHVTDPQRLSRAVFDAFIQDGGEFRQQPVSSITKAGGMVLSVTTPEGEVPVNGAVIAAGQASRRLAGMVGVKAPIVAERGYHVVLEGADVHFEMPVASMDRAVILTPMTDGLRIAGTVEFARAGKPETWSRADAVLAHGRALFPDMGGEETSRWMGERPTLPDFLP